MLIPKKLTSPRWECIHFVTAKEGERIASDLTGGPVLVVSRDASGVTSDGDLFSLLSEAFLFPDYFGRNWDALEECLGDMSWIEASGYVLVLRRADALWKEATHSAGQLVSIWLSLAEQWSRDNVSFHLVFEVS